MGGEMARRKRFAAHVIHPAMLTVLPAPTSIAIAIDRYPTANSVTGTELAGDLLSEIAKYKGLNRITVIFVEGEDTSYGAESPECPQSLLDILASAGKEDIDIKCSNSSTHKGETRLHDVSVVLSNCYNDEFDRGSKGQSTWEEDLYLGTKSIAIKCVGKSYPLDHPSRVSKGINNGRSSNIEKTEHFFVPDLKLHPSSDSFLHAIDYDIFDERGVVSNIAVAFRSIKNGLHRWRNAESNYQLAIHQRWESFATEEETQFFGSADMLRIQFPSRQSASSSCPYYHHLIDWEEGDDDMYCEQGLDPEYPNVPSEKFYISKSTTSENAGRGVFSSIDLNTITYVMAEGYGHDVVFSFRGFEIVESVSDGFCLPKRENKANRNNIRLDSFHCIVGIYYDSYGYNGINRGMPVNTDISTFTNHGCNGTATTCFESEGFPTEFTMLPDGEDPDPETFEIPHEFHKQLYNPNFERRSHLNRYDMIEMEDIPAHTELIDNYVLFGGDKYFLAGIVTIKNQCLGAAGTVVHYETANPGEHKYDVLGSPYVMDIDALRHRQLAYNRRKAHETSDEL